MMAWTAVLWVMVCLTGCGASSGTPDEARAEPVTTVSKMTATALPTVLPTEQSQPTAAITETAGIEPEPATPTLASTSAPSATPTSQPSTAASIPTLPPTPSSPEADVVDPEIAAYGLEVYKQQYCGICHQLDSAGTGGLFGPPQNGMALTAAERIQDPAYSGQAMTAAGYIRESILNPGIYLVEGYEQSRHHMPPFTHLSEAEVEALVQLLLQQK